MNIVHVTKPRTISIKHGLYADVRVVDVTFCTKRLFRKPEIVVETYYRTGVLWRRLSDGCYSYNIDRKIDNFIAAAHQGTVEVATQKIRDSIKDALKDS